MRIIKGKQFIVRVYYNSLYEYKEFDEISSRDNAEQVALMFLQEGAKKVELFSENIIINRSKKPLKRWNN